MACIPHILYFSSTHHHVFTRLIIDTYAPSSKPGYRPNQSEIIQELSKQYFFRHAHTHPERDREKNTEKEDETQTNNMGLPYSRQINAAFDQVTPLVAAGFKVLRTTRDISILLAVIQVLTVILLGFILFALVLLLYCVNPDLEVRLHFLLFFHDVFSSCRHFDLVQRLLIYFNFQSISMCNFSIMHKCCARVMV